MAATPDGRHVVSGSEDNTLRVWDLATGETETTLQGHTSSVSAVAVTPDGRHGFVFPLAFAQYRPFHSFVPPTLSSRALISAGMSSARVLVQAT